MDRSFERIYGSLANAPATSTGRPAYTVSQVPDYTQYYVGRDNESNACILVRATDPPLRQRAPIRLEQIEVQFDVSCAVTLAGQTTEGDFSIVRCRSAESEIVRYFFSIGEAVVHVLGQRPTQVAIAQAFNRLALIFQRMQSPPSGPVNGLFGELFLIRQSRTPLRALAAWRVENVSRFDFSTADIRLDVKTATGRARTHIFAYDQCNPPAGTCAVVASLFVERTAGGMSLQELVADVERLAGDNAELALKLHDIVAGTLGVTLKEALNARFDHRLAASSLRFYDLRTIPGIRGELPAGVTDVHFRSDLSNVGAVSIDTLVAMDPVWSDFLPESS